MSHLSSKCSKEKGNTITSPSLWWVFTFPNYCPLTISKFQVLEGLYIFQEEICPTTKTPHLQGCVKWKTKQRLSAIKLLYPKAHWERCKDSKFDTRTPKKAIAYCQKDESRKPNGKVYTNMNLPKPWMGANLSDLEPWHLDLIKIMKSEADFRTINWYWSDKGKMGKSKFARYAIHNLDALKVSGCGKDILYAVAQWVKTKNLETLIIDIPRSRFNRISYSVLEELKDGDFFSGKYESGMTTLNQPPHVIVFANAPPDEEELSADRWNIVEIGKLGDPKDHEEALVTSLTPLRGFVRSSLRSKSTGDSSMHPSSVVP